MFVRCSHPHLVVSRLALDDLVTKARAVVPEGRLSGVMLRADPTATVVVNFGRERTVFVHPYTGAVLGEGAKTLRQLLPHGDRLASLARHRGRKS